MNDYDLAIQHNEAVQLVRDYLGFQRLVSDSYFDGVYQRQLVKVIPFTHALSPVDLQTIAAELEARPTEDRGIVVVCLGKELAADNWLADWNRLRKGSNAVNRIEVIELRSDAKHGGFLTHQPPEATVTSSQVGRTITVKITDFISPTILQRLAQQSGVLQPVISDWRWMVDSVMIDPSYDGDTFKIVLTDFPLKRSDVVAGEYQVDVPAGAGRLAVKITDMLGEESIIEIAYAS
ncbi:hypothetical protein [Microbacterium arborescens]|uniref:hypothetical protein n=1 Tax=Microbacterium arborescens TaxID=33883 RepID=UPI0027859DF2|nr:hypothetical protein [Microbacterium arborescens]MDQ1217462.1 hypothetical protein [Microbacterium arborescens]